MQFDPYVADPHWGSLIVGYFFLGGIASGSYAVAALARLFGDEADHRVTRGAHYLAFPLVSICGILLIVDLNRPERFWHMMIASETLLPMFKWWSPMSVGSWGLSAFGGFSFVSFLHVLNEDGWLKWRPMGWLVAPLNRRWVAIVFETLGALSAFFVAAYTGTLLSATNQPVWAQSDWISSLFLASAGSGGVSALLIWNHLFDGEGDTNANARFERLDRIIMTIELLVIMIFLVDMRLLGLRVISLWPGILIPALVVPVGLILPACITRWGGRRWALLAPWLVLLGGLILRASVVGIPRSLTLGQHH